MILALAGTILCVVARLAPAVLWPTFAGSDLYFHLSYSDSIRRNRHRLPARDERICGPGHNTYPALFHTLVSLLPEGMVRFLQGYGGILLDAGPAIGAGFFLYKYAGVPASQSVILSGLYMLAPALILIDIGPATHVLSPRWLGRSLYGGGLLALLAFAASHGTVQLGLACLLFSLSILTSKFAVQALVMALPLTALLTASWVPLGVAAFSLLLALVLSRGFLFEQLRGHFRHLEWYIKRQAPFIYKQARVRPLLKAIVSGRWVAAAEEAFIRNPILSGLIRNVLLVVGLAWYEFVRPRHVAVSRNVLELAVGVCLSSVAIWILTSFGTFRVLGEPERYVQLAMPTAWVLFWSLPGDDARPVIIGIVAVVSLIAWAVSVTAAKAYTSRRGVDDFREVLKVIGGEVRPIVLSLDTSETYAFLSEPGVRVCIYNGQESLRGDVEGFLDLLLWRYPWVHGEHLPAIVEQFGVTHISARKATLAQVEAQGGPGYDLSAFAKIFENPSYDVYAVNDLR